MKPYKHGDEIYIVDGGSGARGVNGLQVVVLYTEFNRHMMPSIEPRGYCGYGSGISPLFVVRIRDLRSTFFGEYWRLNLNDPSFRVIRRQLKVIQDLFELDTTD